MLEIIPGINEQDFPSIVKKMNIAQDFVEWAQIDIVDHSLFDNSNFNDHSVFSSLRTNLKLELHMMIDNPQNAVGDWARAGIKRMIAHVEAYNSVESFIAKARQQKVEVGLAIDIETTLDKLLPYLSNIDVALVMAIQTGKSGQKFDLRALARIKKIRELYPDMPLEVDGGINLETGKMAVEAGATRLVSTSFLFNSGSFAQNLKKLQSLES